MRSVLVYIRARFGKLSVDGKEDKARAGERKKDGEQMSRDRVKTHARPITLSRQAASGLKKHSRETRDSHDWHHEKTRGEACVNFRETTRSPFRAACRFYCLANRFSTRVQGYYRRIHWELRNSSSKSSRCVSSGLLFLRPRLRFEFPAGLQSFNYGRSSGSFYWKIVTYSLGSNPN